MACVYETLDSLSFPAAVSDPAPTEYAADDVYSVFRSHITCPSGDSSYVPVVDYFSLDAVRSSSGQGPSRSAVATVSTPVLHSAALSNGLAPEPAWFRGGRTTRSPMLQLHKEILDFCNFVSPTPKEEASRAAAVQRVFEVVKYIWPHCKVEVFGSFKTGLYLPTSDIDVVIFNAKVKTPQTGLYALSRALSQRRIARNIQVIAKARVPIIKFIEKQSEVAFDISFDAENGPRAAAFVQDAVTKMPPLRPLCLILKVFLQQRQLNEVFTGGIGSYALLSMLIAHLKMHWKCQQFPRRQDCLEHNLGVLLVNFFDLYGRKLNNQDVGVSCKSTNTFFLKSSNGYFNLRQNDVISIEDPLAPDNDIGKNSYKYYQVKSAFASAFCALTDARAIMDLGPDRSILGMIIRPDPFLLDRKGGQDGELVFNDLLPGAGEPLLQQVGVKSDVLYNWHLVDDDEPLPREATPAYHYSLSPPKKRKSLQLLSKSAGRVNLTGQDYGNKEDGVGRKLSMNKLRKK